MQCWGTIKGERCPHKVVAVGYRDNLAYAVCPDHQARIIAAQTARIRVLTRVHAR